MQSHVLDLPIEAIRDYCRTQPIQKLSLFGSVLRDDFSPESDVDVLVEFMPNAGIGFFELVEIQDTLAQMIGREVDLLTPKAISKYFRQAVLDSAQAIYEA